jgi:hypothetical protein
MLEGSVRHKGPTVPTEQLRFIAIVRIIDSRAKTTGEKAMGNDDLGALARRGDKSMEWFLWTLIALQAVSRAGKLIWLVTGVFPPRKVEVVVCPPKNVYRYCLTANV